MCVAGAVKKLRYAWGHFLSREFRIFLAMKRVLSASTNIKSNLYLSIE